MQSAGVRGGPRPRGPRAVGHVGQEEGPGCVPVASEGGVRGRLAQRRCGVPPRVGFAVCGCSLAWGSTRRQPERLAGSLSQEEEGSARGHTAANGTGPRPGVEEGPERAAPSATAVKPPSAPVASCCTKTSAAARPTPSAGGVAGYAQPYLAMIWGLALVCTLALRPPELPPPRHTGPPEEGDGWGCVEADWGRLYVGGLGEGCLRDVHSRLEGSPSGQRRFGGCVPGSLASGPMHRGVESTSSQWDGDTTTVGRSSMTHGSSSSCGGGAGQNR